MKIEVLQIAGQTADPLLKLNLLREYLHKVILRSWHEQGAFQMLSFVGGTALRLLFQLPRFSEDLDFSLENKSALYDPESWQKKLLRELQLSGLEATVKWNPKPTVQVGWVRISRLLREAGVTPDENQNLSIKIEVDTNPPSGAVSEKAIRSDPFFWGVRHHDLSSLMAGKITAALTRPYEKGRDWFDLLWYLSRTPPVRPNLPLLKSGLSQSNPEAAENSLQWRELIRMKLETLNWDHILKDVQPLIEHPSDLVFFTKENLLSTLDKE